MILPLALAQFIASYAATNMNVAISAIATDLDTTVRIPELSLQVITRLNHPPEGDGAGSAATHTGSTHELADYAGQVPDRGGGHGA